MEPREYAILAGSLASQSTPNDYVNQHRVKQAYVLFKSQPLMRQHHLYINRNYKMLICNAMLRYAVSQDERRSIGATLQMIDM